MVVLSDESIEKINLYDTIDEFRNFIKNNTDEKLISDKINEIKANVKSVIDTLDKKETLSQHEIIKVRDNLFEFFNENFLTHHILSNSEKWLNILNSILLFEEFILTYSKLYFIRNQLKRYSDDIFDYGRKYLNNLQFCSEYLLHSSKENNIFYINAADVFTINFNDMNSFLDKKRDEIILILTEFKEKFDNFITNKEDNNYKIINTYGGIKVMEKWAELCFDLLEELKSGKDIKQIINPPVKKEEIKIVNSPVKKEEIKNINVSPVKKEAEKVVNTPMKNIIKNDNDKTNILKNDLEDCKAQLIFSNKKVSVLTVVLMILIIIIGIAAILLSFKFVNLI